MVNGQRIDRFQLATLLMCEGNTVLTWHRHDGTTFRGTLQAVERESGNGRTFNVRVTREADGVSEWVFIRTQ